MSKTLLVTRVLGGLGAVAALAVLYRLIGGEHSWWGVLGLGAAAVLILVLSAATVLFGMLLELAHERAVDAAAWRSAGSDGFDAARQKAREEAESGRRGTADPARGESA
ncbi:hypothetical protein ODJ79_19495 [Actinoplanes sp. KI2]|uniref:hypothetical protein n=1 Tax=Actinoplanes sp. KI2 TaxID=2983315 RepID=UPI0021D5EA30|nr:hypothetical protein [Actinoplanes sp. KI2]MCU7725916.1 hypothetical protein [Actinoplanes sp. KI2]